MIHGFDNNKDIRWLTSAALARVMPFLVACINKIFQRVSAGQILQQNQVIQCERVAMVRYPYAMGIMIQPIIRTWTGNGPRRSTARSLERFAMTCFFKTALYTLRPHRTDRLGHPETVQLPGDKKVPPACIIFDNSLSMSYPSRISMRLGVVTETSPRQDLELHISTSNVSPHWPKYM